MAGWWLTYPSEKYEFVNWDDEIPNWIESHKIPWFQTFPNQKWMMWMCLKLKDPYKLSKLNDDDNDQSIWGYTIRAQTTIFLEIQLRSLMIFWGILEG